MREIGPTIEKYIGKRHKSEIAARLPGGAPHLSKLISTTKGQGDKIAFVTIEKIAEALGVSVAVFSDKDNLVYMPANWKEWEEWLKMLVIILESENMVFRTAIQSNLAAFSSSVMLAKENIELKAENTQLKQSQKGESDFKTEQHRERRRSPAV